AVRGGVHDQREIFRTAIAKRTNEDVRKAGAAKARYEDRRPIGNISQRLGGTRDTLVDRHCDSVLLVRPNITSPAECKPNVLPSVTPPSCPRTRSPCPTSRFPRQ